MEDFDTLQQVLDAYRAGTIDDDQALDYINALTNPFGNSPYDPAEEKRRLDDHLRMEMVRAVLQRIPYENNIPSDVAARFAWDTAQHIMKQRAEGVASNPTPMPLPPVDMNLVKSALLAEATNTPMSQAESDMLNRWRSDIANGATPNAQMTNAQNTEAWKPRDIVSDEGLSQASSAKWGDGSTYGDGTVIGGVPNPTSSDGHDDGPF